MALLQRNEKTDHGALLIKLKAKMTAAIEHLKNELKSIRTGRANPGMLDGVTGRSLWQPDAH